MCTVPPLDQFGAMSPPPPGATTAASNCNDNGDGSYGTGYSPDGLTPDITNDPMEIKPDTSTDPNMGIFKNIPPRGFPYKDQNGLHFEGENPNSGNTIMPRLGI